MGVDAQRVGAVQAAKSGREAGTAAAGAPYAPSTCSQTPASAATVASASSGSTAPVDVVPALATTQIGNRPAARSEAIAVRSAAGSSRRSRSTATGSNPTPSAVAALATEKCVSADAYTRIARRSSSGPVTARSATSSAVRLAADPPLTRIPVAASSNPTNSPSQRNVWCSTAAAAGPDRHDVRF